jgi:SAM-dependent methyltransferase
MTADPQEQRRESAEHWEEAAPGWERRQEDLREFGAPVSRWLVEAIHPQPGHHVLELAAGIGETGFMAAELIAPGGKLISSDQSEAMIAAGRRRAEGLGLTNVEFKVMDAEWIDLPVASQDAVLCRWGYMLMTDPLAALTETRRVLRPGGRVALAVWDASEHNPWARVPGALLVERGLMPRPDPGAPGPFALGDPERLRGLLEEAGFTDVEIDTVAVAQRHPSFDSFWDALLDLSRNTHDAVMGAPEPEIEAVRAALRERLQPFTREDGSLEVPGRTLVAAADA